MQISKRYNERPSKILGIEDKYIAFCFDEACETILSMRETKTKTEKGLTYQYEDWKRKPHFIDEVKPFNNSELIQEMQYVLENKKYR